MNTRTRNLTAITVIVALVLVVSVLAAALMVPQGKSMAPSATPHNSAANFVPDNSFGNADPNAQIPEDATQIASAEDFKKWLAGEEGFNNPYGVLIEDITINWMELNGNGASLAILSLAPGKTFDGNGHMVTLSPGGDSEMVQVQLNDGSGRELRTAGLFVAQNSGTIQNVKFTYDKDVLLWHGKQLGLNCAGVICGTNSGTIRNVSLKMDAKFSYDMNSNAGQSSSVTSWDILVGGVAGLQEGVVEDVYVNMTANAQLYGKTTATNGSIIGIARNADARVSVGSVAGRVQGEGARVERVILQADNGAGIHADANKAASGTAYRHVGMIVGANSPYSGSDTPGVINNVVAYSASPDTFFVSQSTSGAHSNYSLVDCGLVTNGTIIATKGETLTDFAGVQADNCNCSNGDQHDTITPNHIVVNGNADLSFSFDAADGYKQKVTVSTEAEDKDDTLLKYHIDDKAVGAVTDKMHVAQKLELTLSSGDTTDKYSNVEIVSGNYGKMTFALDRTEVVYNGKDFAQQVQFTSQDGSIVSTVEGLQAQDWETGEPMQGGVLYPRETPYSFTVTTGQIAGFAAIDLTNRLAYPMQQIPYSLTIKKAQLQGLADMAEFAQNYQTTLTIADGAADALDGFTQQVGNVNPVKFDGTNVNIAVETSADGRTYKIVGYKNGIAVTEEATVLVKIDTTAPTAEMTAAAGVDNWIAYDTTIRVKGADALSGIANISLHDGTQEVQLSEADGDGYYTVAVDAHKTYTLTVTDKVGNVTTRQLEVKIDKTQLQLNPTAFINGAEGEVPVENGGSVTSTAYLRAGAVVGEAGATLAYSLDGGSSWTDCASLEELVRLAGVGEHSVLFRLTSNAVDAEGNPVTKVSDAFTLTVTKVEIVLTADQLQFVDGSAGVVTDITKVYDATNALVGATLTLTGNIEQDGKTLAPDQITFAVTYTNVHVGEGIALQVTIVSQTNEEINVTLSPDLAYTGKITKAPLTVKANGATKAYGSEVGLTCTLEGLKGNDNFVFTAHSDGQDKLADVVEGGYAITIDPQDLADYEVTYDESAVVTVTPYIIDRYASINGITGLYTDGTDHVADVWAKWTDVNGVERTFAVTFEQKVGEEWQATDKLIDAGNYRAIFSLQAEDGLNLANYKISDSGYRNIAVAEFSIAYVESTIPEPDPEQPGEGEEQPEVPADGNETQQADSFIETPAGKAGISIAVIAGVAAIACVAGALVYTRKRARDTK